MQCPILKRVHNLALPCLSIRLSVKKILEQLILIRPDAVEFYSFATGHATVGLERTVTSQTK